MVLAAALLGLALFAAGADACTSSMSCELNGACTAGKCVCDRGWKGAACGQLDIGPRKLAYGNGVTPNTSCWGGGPPVLDPLTGKYHLLVTEIADGCGMATWARMSQTTLAVSDTAAGPFTKVSVAIPTFSHNTFYAFSPPDKKHLVYHIGYGADPPSCNPRLSCRDGSTPGGSGIKPPAGTPWAPDTCGHSRAAFVHAADSLAGPWIPAGPIKFSGPMPSRADGTAGSSNPSPLFFPNGTVLMMGRGKDAGRGPNNETTTGHNIWLYRAPAWNASYEWVRSNGKDGSVMTYPADGPELTEDPVLWKGRNGYHVLYHTERGGTGSLTHGWSEDAITWQWNPQVMGPAVDPEGLMGDFQRPRVVVTPEGDVETIFVSQETGKGEQGDGADASSLVAFETPNRAGGELNSA